jgi:hypothetical protein
VTRLLTRLAVVLVLAGTACGAKTPTQASPTAVAATSQPSTKVSAPTAPATTSRPEAVVTLAAALDAIGATCGKPVQFESKCQWDGPSFRTFGMPSAGFESYRDQLCPFISPNPLVFTGGTKVLTWSVYGDDDPTTKVVAKALVNAGLAGRVEPYC